MFGFSRPAEKRLQEHSSGSSKDCSERVQQALDACDKTIVLRFREERRDEG